MYSAVLLGQYRHTPRVAFIVRNPAIITRYADLLSRSDARNFVRYTSVRVCERFDALTLREAKAIRLAWSLRYPLLSDRCRNVATIYRGQVQTFPSVVAAADALGVCIATIRRMRSTFREYDGWQFL
jgi:hypothetical protein